MAAAKKGSRRQRRRYSDEEKEAVVRDAGEIGVSGAAGKHGVPKSNVSQWCKRALGSGGGIEGSVVASAAAAQSTPCSLPYSSTSAFCDGVYRFTTRLEDADGRADEPSVFELGFASILLDFRCVARATWSLANMPEQCAHLVEHRAYAWDFGERGGDDHVHDPFAADDILQDRNQVGLRR